MSRIDSPFVASTLRDPQNLLNRWKEGQSLDSSIEHSSKTMAYRMRFDAAIHKVLITTPHGDMEPVSIEVAENILRSMVEQSDPGKACA